jgi:group I intron endonuclease
MVKENPLIGKSEIYMVINKVTGKRYIGQTACFYKRSNGRYDKMGLEIRWKGHIHYAKKNVQGRGARCLMNNIQKYGVHNFIIKPIFICPTEQANYWEIKFIRQYDTQTPNGMNIMKGGKNSPLTEITKSKISEARKGKYGGENNPMWGKHHTEETILKIKNALIGKPLPDATKTNMSKAHAKNMEEGVLPPRRKHSDLPKYIYHVKSKNKEGYEIRNHPTLKQKQFTMKTITLEENLQRAINYLKDINNAENQKINIQFRNYDNLPRFIRHVRCEKFEGFEIKFHPTLSNKKWTNMKLSMEQKLDLAKKYLEEGSETKRLSVKP